VITAKAPAKINLTLEVLGKRPDGYHEIRSVFQTIDFCDILNFNDSKDISITCDMPGWSAEKSLVSKAVKILHESADCQHGVEIKIEKRIPLSSGLGGDSSDAAVVLKNLNDFWKLKLTEERIFSLAMRLGSDVPFFLRGGTALIEGRGEIITPLPSPQNMWAVLIVPDIAITPGKTGRMYATLKPSHFTDGSITKNLVATLKKGNQFDPSLWFNTFENVAFDFFQGLNVYKEHLIKLGAPNVHLAGSGPVLYCVFQRKVQTQELFQRMKDQRMRAWLATIK